LTDQANITPGHPSASLNILPILHEVRHCVQRLIDSGDTSTIDLRAIPLMPGEENELREHLGSGEVLIQINALGVSTLSETAYSGVWWVEHRNSAEEITGLYIDISLVPTIVPPVDDDLTEGLARLSEYLESEFQS
jgi:hydrogenase-1 operon protein HyaF